MHIVVTVITNQIKRIIILTSNNQLSFMNRSNVILKSRNGHFYCFILQNNVYYKSGITVAYVCVLI